MKRIFVLIIILLSSKALYAKDSTFVILSEELSQINNIYNTCDGSKWLNQNGWPISNEEYSARPFIHGLNFIDSIVSSDSFKVSIILRCHSIILNNNRLSGVLPNLNLAYLDSLDLNNNSLFGEIPDFNLPNLEFLDLSENKLSGVIPNFKFIKLTNLLLHNNLFGGCIPSFNLPNLYELNLSYNRLKGNIPYFNCFNLNYLILSHNSLSGCDSICQFHNYGDDFDYYNKISINDNKLTFKELENIYKNEDYSSYYYHQWYGYYKPQDTTLEIRQINDTLKILTEGEYNTYSWYKDSAFYKLTKDNYIKLRSNDYGSKFYCQIKNSLFDSLILKSREWTPFCNISDERSVNNLEVYPNPARDKVRLNYSFEDGDNINVEIYNDLGKQVLSLSSIDSDVSRDIDISSLPSGSYSLVLKINNNATVRQLIVLK